MKTESSQLKEAIDAIDIRSKKLQAVNLQELDKIKFRLKSYKKSKSILIKEYDTKISEINKKIQENKNKIAELEKNHKELLEEKNTIENSHAIKIYNENKAILESIEKGTYTIDEATINKKIENQKPKIKKPFDLKENTQAIQDQIKKMNSPNLNNKYYGEEKEEVWDP